MQYELIKADDMTEVEKYRRCDKLLEDVTAKLKTKPTHDLTSKIVPDVVEEGTDCVKRRCAQ